MKLISCIIQVDQAIRENASIMEGHATSFHSRILFRKLEDLLGDTIGASIIIVRVGEGMVELDFCFRGQRVYRARLIPSLSTGLEVSFFINHGLIQRCNWDDHDLYKARDAIISALTRSYPTEACPRTGCEVPRALIK